MRILILGTKWEYMGTATHYDVSTHYEVQEHIAKFPLGNVLFLEEVIHARTQVLIVHKFILPNSARHRFAAANGRYGTYAVGS